MRPVYVLKIVATPGGLGVLDELSGNIVSAGEELRNNREAVAFIQDFAAQKGMYAMNNAQGSVTKYEVYSPLTLNVSMSAEMSETLTDLARELGITKAATIIKAITLLKIAAQAKREGKAFGIVDDAGVLSDEIIGI